MFKITHKPFHLILFAREADSKTVAWILSHLLDHDEPNRLPAVDVYDTYYSYIYIYTHLYTYIIYNYIYYYIIIYNYI